MIRKHPLWLNRELLDTLLVQYNSDIQNNLPGDLFSRLLMPVYKAGEISDTELFSRIFGRLCDDILDTPTALLPLNYATLPETMPEIVAPLFDVRIDDEGIERAMGVPRKDVKSFRESNEFVSDSEKKQRALTPEIRQLTDCHINPSLEKIKLKGWKN